MAGGLIEELNKRNKRIVELEEGMRNAVIDAYIAGFLIGIDIVPVESLNATPSQIDFDKEQRLRSAKCNAINYYEAINNDN